MKCGRMLSVGEQVRVGCKSKLFERRNSNSAVKKMLLFEGKSATCAGGGGGQLTCTPSPVSYLVGSSTAPEPHVHHLSHRGSTRQPHQAHPKFISAHQHDLHDACSFAPHARASPFLLHSIRLFASLPSQRRGKTALTFTLVCVPGTRLLPAKSQATYTHGARG